jgi:hypothetical protein
MTTSTVDEIIRKALAAAAWGSGLGVAGGLVALVIGLLTVSVQATVKPSHLPLAISAPQPLVDRLREQAGDEVDWRQVSSQAEAERLLDDKRVYGAVLLNPGPTGPTATVVLSGAVNPSATQVAQPLLTQVGGALVAAAQAQSAARPAATTSSIPAQAAPAKPAVQVITIHQVSPAGLLVPLAASLLLWLTTFFASILANVVAPRARGARPLGRSVPVVTAAMAAVAGTILVVGLARVWDQSLAIGLDVIGFMALVGLAFALLQAAVLRWTGLAGIPLLALTYLMAPAAAGLPSEVLSPVYRNLIWSWLPFRFSAEGIRSLLYLGSQGPGVQEALWLFGGIAVGALVLMVAPKPRRRPSPTLGAGLVGATAPGDADGLESRRA